MGNEIKVDFGVEEELGWQDCELLQGFDDDNDDDDHSHDDDDDDDDDEEEEEVEDGYFKKIISYCVIL